MSNIVRRRDGFILDMMKMIAQGSSNDVKIVLKDGEIYANKDILSARCAYFATCFSNSEVKFNEGETNSVTFDHCNKNVMEKIINYLFTGDMKLYDFSLVDLLNMMNMTKMMMIDDLLDDIRKFVLNYITDSGVNYSAIPELVEGLMLAERFKLETIKDSLVLELYRSLRDIPHIPDVVQNSDVFTSLPVNLLEDILLHIAETDMFYDKSVTPTTKQRFDAFVFWLEKNQCDEEERTDITESFWLSDFTGQELLTDVRRSGLFSIQKIDSKVLEILNSCQDNVLKQEKEITTCRKDLVKKEKELTMKNDVLTTKVKDISNEVVQYKRKLAQKDKIIAQKDSILNSRLRSINEKDSIIGQKDTELRKLNIKLNEDKMKRCYSCR